MLSEILKQVRLEVKNLRFCKIYGLSGEWMLTRSAERDGIIEKYSVYMVNPVWRIAYQFLDVCCANQVKNSNYFFTILPVFFV